MSYSVQRSRKQIGFCVLALVALCSGCASNQDYSWPQDCEPWQGKPATGYEISYCWVPQRIGMPPLIDKPILRLAIIPSNDKNAGGLPPFALEEIYGSMEAAWQQNKHWLPNLEIVERSRIDLALSELRFQAGGHVRDDHFVGVGRMLGADHILVYKVMTSSDNDLESLRLNGGSIRGIASGKMIRVETGTVVFQDTIRQDGFLRPPSKGQRWLGDIPSAKAVAVQEAIAGLINALLEAVLPSPVGMEWLDEPGGKGVRVNLVLINGPAYNAGIQRGDFITAIDGIPVHREMDTILHDMETIPHELVRITIERQGREQTVAVRPKLPAWKLAPIKGPERSTFPAKP